MTANELAQLLFKRWNGDDVEIPPNLDDLCSEMLQKQQAKIEASQEHNANLVDDLFSERKEVLRLEAEIEALKLRELTDEEILEACFEYDPDLKIMDLLDGVKEKLIQRGRAILKKARE